jgi:large subunit ribosomal protein L22
MKQVKEQRKEEVKETGRSAKAVLRFVRIAPRKVRVVIDAIRFDHPSVAFDKLMTLKKKAARLAEKLLKSAVANAKNIGLDESRLYISDIRADGGPTMKRFMERSMGRANRIIKRTTHLQITVKEGEKRWTVPSSQLEAGEEKESPKSTKKPSVRKKKTAGAGA